MYQRTLCPRCQNRKLYTVRRAKKRCSGCGYEFKPRLVKGIRLSSFQWHKLIEWFLLERSGLWTAKKTGLGKNLVYKAFKQIRQARSLDIPGIFSGTVEVDETYSGGQKKNNKTKNPKEALGLKNSLSLESWPDQAKFLLAW